jgi:hypothetical protein
MTERVNRAMKLQTSRITKSFWFSIGLGALFSYTQFNGDSTFWGIVVALLASQLVYIPLKEYAIWKTVRDVYGGNIHLMKKDSVMLQKQIDAEAEMRAKGQVAMQVELVIDSHSSEVFGTFKDCPYYEFLVVKDHEGNLWKFEFSGTMDLDEGITRAIGTNEIVLMPGIVYKSVCQVDENFTFQ